MAKTKASLHKTYLACLGIALAYTLLVVPFNEHRLFSHDLTNQERLRAVVLKGVFTVVVSFLLLFAWRFYVKLRRRDRMWVKWIKYTAIYWGVMFAIFLLIYPGHWLGDETSVLSAVRQYGAYSWQGYLTNIYYTLCLYAFPSAIAIVLIQFSIIAVIVGYLISRFEALVRKSPWLLFIPFLLPPILVYNFYPERMVLYSYLELLLISKLVFINLGSPKLRSKANLIAMTILIALVSFWRTEGTYYLLLLPFIFFWFKKAAPKSHKQRNSWHWMATVTLCCLIVAAVGVLTVRTSDKRYELTAEMNPLSTMLQTPLKGSHVDQRLDLMNQVVNINVVKQYLSYTEVPSFWKGGVRPNYAAHLNNFREQYVYLVIHNPRPFLNNRVRVFLSTNSLYAQPSASLGPFDTPYYMTDPTVSPLLKKILCFDQLITS